MEDIFENIQNGADELRRLEYDYKKWRQDIMEEKRDTIELYCDEILKRLKHIYRLNFDRNIMDLKLYVGFDDYGVLLRYHVYIFIFDEDLFKKEQKGKERIYSLKLNSDVLELQIVNSYPPKYSDVRDIATWSLYGDEIRFKMKSVELPVEDHMIILDDIKLINQYLKPCSFPLYVMFKYFFNRYCKDDKIVETRISILYILYHYYDSDLSVFPYEIILKICKMAHIAE